ncbi:MAG: isocitrate/isopropylmalate dehydrogenase family protein [Dehalococcoidia bacterium]|jgi:isocitrate dehydrogenase (NAD+)|nr:isocitrate/isopropylmalate dehydrogenase family protein [Dehalococcoidia bacterium]MDP7469204.1 isocitrate/isopropylmalate dehydrogenase family protein [Dehalococcoidia bacterium]
MSNPYSVTVIPGDGVGPEVTKATVKVLEATGVKFQWEPVEAGEAVVERYGTPLPEEALASIGRTKLALKGPLTTPVGFGFRSINVSLRKQFDLYACLRPCLSFPGAPSRYEDVDLIVVRENTEDLYIGLEFEKGTPEMARLQALVAEDLHEDLEGEWGVSLKAISEAGSRRILKFGFDYAQAHGRKKVTAVHKANILKYTDGMFLAIAREVAGDYPGVEFEDIIIDNLCMQLVRNPDRFDVLVLPNLYGDIISDLCAGLIGGLGLAPGANIGEGAAIFEPTHGSAPRYAGQDRMNPMAMILSGAMLLRHLGEDGAAVRVEQAVGQVIQEGNILTYDLSRQAAPASTSQVAEAVIEAMRRSHA